MITEAQYFTCKCRHPEHIFQLYFAPADLEKDKSGHRWEPFLEGYFTLNPNVGFFKRCWYGLKYIFGFGSERTFRNSIMFDEMDDAAITRLQTLLANFQKDRAEYEKL